MKNIFKIWILGLLALGGQNLYSSLFHISNSVNRGDISDTLSLVSTTRFYENHVPSHVQSSEPTFPEYQEIKDKFLKAVRHYDIATVDDLLQNYDRLVDMSDEFNVTPLMSAILGHNVRLINKLLQYDPDVNLLNWNGDTALIFASKQRGFSNIVKELLERGANPNHQNDDGVTALMCAAFNGREDSVNVLLSHHADSTIQDLEGRTALMYAIQANHDRIIQMLQRHDALRRSDNHIDRPIN